MPNRLFTDAVCGIEEVIVIWTFALEQGRVNVFNISTRVHQELSPKYSIEDGAAVVTILVDRRSYRSSSLECSFLEGLSGVVSLGTITSEVVIAIVAGLRSHLSMR